MKRFLALLVTVLCVFSLSSALAQTVSCPVGGFSLVLPDHFVEEPLDPFLAPDLCFYWHGTKLTIQGYATYQGEVAGSDLFQVLTGYETDYGPVTINGMNMLYARTDDDNGITIIYTWMDRGNNVTLYFIFSAADASVVKNVDQIIHSITFDAGH